MVRLKVSGSEPSYGTYRTYASHGIAPQTAFDWVCSFTSFLIVYPPKRGLANGRS